MPSSGERTRAAHSACIRTSRAHKTIRVRACNYRPSTERGPLRTYSTNVILVFIYQLPWTGNHRNVSVIFSYNPRISPAPHAQTGVTRSYLIYALLVRIYIVTARPLGPQLITSVGSLTCTLAPRPNYNDMIYHTSRMLSIMGRA